MREITHSTRGRVPLALVDTDRLLGSTPFAGDDGRPSAATREALAASEESAAPAAYLRAVAVLCGDRLLVPVVARAIALQPAAGGRVSDKEAEMSVVSLAAPDGRRGLLIFTGIDALQSWDPAARPVPVTLDVAASAAVADGGSALLVDVAGPHPLVIDTEVLARLAAGHRLVELSDGSFGWAVRRSE